MKALSKEVAAPEAPKLDEKQQLQQDYYRACAEAGEIQYKMEIMQIDLDNINLRLRDINTKFAELNKKEQEANVKA